jgi:anaerobic dimethyl sulfoxide reductase subunit B (iron-sulfur subunit)
MKMKLMNQQYGFSFDAQRCLKCWACEVACKQWHGINAGGLKLRRVEEVTRGVFPNVTRTFLSLSCRHCARPRCAASCVSGAISKRDNDGIVLVDRSKCDGCRSCLDACPFGIPQFDTDGTMRKCDMCLDRIEKGQKPVCVETCPTRALQWGAIEDLSNQAFWQTAKKMTDCILPLSMEKNENS